MHKRKLGRSSLEVVPLALASLDAASAAAQGSSTS
jgi:hypothetical protein